MIVSPEAGAETVAAQALPPQVLVVVQSALWINVGHWARATPPKQREHNRAEERSEPQNRKNLFHFPTPRPSN